MTEDEKILLEMMELMPDSNAKAVLLQSYIAEKGPLSEEAGAKVRELLSRK